MSATDSIILLFDRVRVRRGTVGYARGIVVGFDRQTVRIVFDDEEKGAFVPLKDIFSLRISNVHLAKVELEDA